MLECGNRTGSTTKKWRYQNQISKLEGSSKFANLINWSSSNLSIAANDACLSTSIEKKIRWVKWSEIASQSTPEYRHSGKYPTTANFELFVWVTYCPSAALTVSELLDRHQECGYVINNKAMIVNFPCISDLHQAGDFSLVHPMVSAPNKSPV